MEDQDIKQITELVDTRVPVDDARYYRIYSHSASTSSASTSSY